MNKDIEGTKTCFILIAEDASGRTIVCESFGTEKDGIGAFEVLFAPTVCLLKQVCMTQVVAHKES